MISYTRCRVKIVRCGAADRAGERKVLVYLSCQRRKMRFTRSAAVLKKFGPPEAVETAKLCEKWTPFLIVSMCAALRSIKGSVSHSLHHTDLVMTRGMSDVISNDIVPCHTFFHCIISET